MSLYADFVKETLGWQTLEDCNSFVTYDIIELESIKTLKIMEMFIDKSARGKDKSKDLLDALKTIAQDNGCNRMSAQLSNQASEFIKQRTTHICRLFGMTKVYEDERVIIFSRSI